MSYEKLNAMQIITAGSDDDCVALAPAGTKAPTTLAIPATFKEVGWIDKDGIEFTADDSVDKRRAHQEEICYAALNAGSSVSIVMSPVNVPVIL